MRTGDIVFHRPSEEEWVVAWADHQTGYMAPCGWPTCQARIADCSITRKATDEESDKLTAILSKSGRSDGNKAAEIAGRRALQESGQP